VNTPAVFLRKARIRGLKEALVQTARTEAMENDAKDAIERLQDYGFAANVVDGQGLIMTVGGTTFVLRMDRIAERPRLQAFEVSVWHKEGHNMTLKDGKLIEVNCDTFKVNAAVKAEFNTPLVAMSAKATVGDTLAVTSHVTGGANATFAGLVTANSFGGQSMTVNSLTVNGNAAITGSANIGGRMTSATATVATKIIEGHTHNETGAVTLGNN
jgi:phage gp45-like